MITIHANLKTGERRIVEQPHPDDQPITAFTSFLLPDVLEKLQKGGDSIEKR